MNNVFANNLKKLRLEKKLTQEQVADILGVGSQTISRWECNTTYPDVMLLPEIAKLYCVTVDDLFKAESSAYENYAQRLASVYEMTRDPEDFIRADFEFKKLMKKGECSAEDLRTYGIIYHFMMYYSMNKAIELFDKVLDDSSNVNTEVFWKTKNQKMLLYSQIGKSKDNISDCLKEFNEDSSVVGNWRYLILAYMSDNDYKGAYECFNKAIKKFPDDAILYTLGGDICRKIGQHNEALLYWDKSIELDSSCLDAKYSKTNYYEEIGEYNKCYALLLEIIEELKSAGLDVEASAEQKKADDFYKNILLPNNDK